MKFGFVRTAAAAPDLKVADCRFNSKSIIKCIKEAYSNSAELVVFPELCITGYTCGDLFNQPLLIETALEYLCKAAESTRDIDIAAVVGFPFEYNSNLYNCAAVLCGGKIRGIIPKTFIPNYNEFYEKRYFRKAMPQNHIVEIMGEKIIFGTKQLFKVRKHFIFAVEICEDLWAAIPPSSYHAQAGATIIANASAGNEITGKSEYRRSLVCSQSARLISGYIYSCAGEGESTTDVVFSAHNIIAENGKLLKESKRFKNSIIYADIDTDSLSSDRIKNTTFKSGEFNYDIVNINIKSPDAELHRYVNPMPFVPSDKSRRRERCEEILNIQAYGLKKRIEHIGTKTVAIGISGGLDSTQSLIAAVRAFDIMGLDRKGILTITMPCFGTSSRTYSNAVKMCRIMGTNFKEINIRDSVNKHFEDIGQDSDIHDLTYENSQARERTQVLMDISSKYGGFVVGTGDLSELALGFATYNGDHMSMYGVNASVPKTLIRHLISFYADEYADGELREVLYDILDTPVSPELLPPEADGSIRQVTEDIVGPYELHDFFLYNMMRMGFEPDKIFYLAKIAFRNKYEDEIILKWLKSFYKRFFSQQFKRSALPDGPKVGSVSLSPRGDWRMPSDADASIWLNSLE